MALIMHIFCRKVRQLGFWLMLSHLLICTRLEAKTLVIQDNQDYYSLSPYAQYLEEKNSAYELQDLLRGKGSWHQLADGKDIIGYSPYQLWFKFELASQSDKISQLGFLSKSAQYTMFDIYLVKNGQLIQTRNMGYSGQNIHATQGPRQPQMRFELKKGETATLWIHGKNPRLINLSMYLMPADTLDVENFWDNGILAFCGGAMVALLFYNMILYIALRDRSYLYYVLWMLTMTITIAINTSMFDYLGLNSSAWCWNEKGMPFIALPAAAGCQFSRKFLALHKQQPILDKIFLLCIGVSLLLFGLLLIVKYPQGESLITACYLMCVVLSTVGGIRAYRLGNQSAATYLWAYGLFSISAVLWIMSENNVLPRNVFLTNAATLGNAVEMVLMSLALAQRIKAMQKRQMITEYHERENESLHHFIRMLCHDVSNPLAVIQGAHELSQAFDHTPMIQKLWDKVGRGGLYIGEIIAHVRKIETSRTGKISAKLVPTSLKGTIDKAFFLFEEKAKRKNIYLSFEMPKNGNDVLIDVDPVTFSHEVLHNIVSNAIKFTSHGGYVCLEVIEQGAHVVVQVTDDGIGIPTDIMEKLFDVYRSSSRPGTDNELGTGFGMPLVKNFVDSFGGTLEVISPALRDAPDRPGTIVRIKLPKSTAQSVAPPTAQPDEQKAA